jgi:transcriptional antiterminator RfaH
MSEYWYALRSKPRKEKVVEQQILMQGFDVYFPQLRVNPVNPRSHKWKAYFPGYLFVLADLEAVGISTFQYMPHTLGLVTFGGEIATVPESLLIAIRKKLDAIQAAGGEIIAGLRQGDLVRINEGPFQGYEAIFDIRLPGVERVRVLLKLLGSQRQVPVELNAGQIVRKR